MSSIIAVTIVLIISGMAVAAFIMCCKLVKQADDFDYKISNIMDTMNYAYKEQKKDCEKLQEQIEHLQSQIKDLQK